MTDMSVNQDSLDLEETNKLRISMGLAPIGGEGADVEPDEDDVAEANFAARKAEMKKAREAEELQEKIAKLKNRSALYAQLQGQTLGSASKDDSISAKDFVKRQKKMAKKREREQAERRQREMEEADKAVYDESDLAGLKVAHKADEFETGEDIILTLKDSRVLQGDEDELQNVNMVDDEAIMAAKERKRKAQEAYTGYDDEEFEEGRIGVKADVLGKYDDSFSSGKVKTEGFRLGAPIEKKIVVDEDDTVMMGSEPATKVKLSLDFTKDFEVSDYLKEGDPGFKQRKKKKAKRSTRRPEGDDEDRPTMDVDAPPVFSKRAAGDGPENLVDDDDLQAALARSRREQAKKKPKIKVEDLAAQIAQRKEEEQQEDVAQNGDEDGRITFDDTSEFVRNVTIESRAAPVKRERAATPQAAEPVVVKIERGEEGEVDEEDMDVDSEDEDSDLAEMAAREGLSLEEYRLKIDSQMKEIEGIKTEQEESEEEAVKGGGVAGVLNLLRQQGALKSQTEQDQERERVQRQKDLWLADHRKRMAKRELERIKARGENKDQAQREWEARTREQQEIRDAMESFKNYRPDINIIYHDEFGREMTPKEAWKSLSHKFHGKGSGRMKTEKRLRKIAEERKQLTMSSGDTPTGMTDAFARRQQKTGEAHMVLSVGNKGSVQQSSSKGKVRR